MFGKSSQGPDLMMFALYDNKAEMYLDPIKQPNVALAIRELNNVFADPQSQQAPIVLNAEDFSLFKIAEFDRRTGKMTGVTPQHIVNLHEIRAAHQRPGIPDLGIAST